MMRKLLTRKIYQTREQKRNDFIIGLLGWPVGNVILYVAGLLGAFILMALVGMDTWNDLANSQWSILAVALPLLLNVAALIYLGVTRRWIAFGALAFLGALLLLTVCLAVIVGGLCFVILGSGGQIP